MDILSNLDILPVGIVIAAIGILGSVVYYHGRKSTTHRTFLFFSFAAILWNGWNYITYQFASPTIILWSLRATLFFAVWYSFFLFRFFAVFPKQNMVFHKWYYYFAIPGSILASLIILTPFALTKINKYPGAPVGSKDVIGFGMGIFGATVFCLILSGVVILIRKFKNTSGNERKQYLMVLVGALITFSLYLTFNFVFPVFLGNIAFLPYGAFYTFPLIAFTSFAIFKYKLLDVKVISTEILTFAMSMAVLVEVVLSENVYVIILRSFIFLLVLSVGILLIRSVRKEVEQRQQLSHLTKRLEKANEHLQELDQLKTEFLSIATHQLRTPLSIIKGYTSLMQDGAYGKMPKKAFPILDNIDVSNERLIKLVDEFLNVSRIEQGRTQYRFVSTPIKELAEGVVTELKQRALPKHITLDLAIGKGVKNADMDEDKIRHGLYNFVDNAIKYSPGKTSVHISIEEKDGGVAFHVVDEGVGMDEKDLKNLFQKFYRSEHVLRDFQGTGLGLFVVKQFTEAHHGKVWAKSKGIGKGSEFGMWIPVKQKTASAVQEKE